MYKVKLFVASTLILCSQAQAKYVQIKNCGKAKVQSGDTCSNVKVAFDLSDCEVQAPVVEPKKVICAGNTVKIRHTQGEYRYETQFEKIDDGWGSVEWKYIGAIKQWKKEKPLVKPVATDIANVNHEEKIQRAINSSAVVAAAPSPVASSTKISGFVDFRLTNYSEKADATVKNTNPESGFALEDGAIFLNHESGAFSFVIDTPFRRYKNSDNSTYGAGAQPNASTNGTVLFGADKAQAYAKYKANSYLNVTMGQFDTPYGVELNDSKDRHFGKTGIVYDKFLPVTHTGAMVEYVADGAYAKAFSANPNNKGSLGESATGDVNYEYGAVAGYSNEKWRTQLGYLIRSINKADATGGGSRTLVDIILGTTQGDWEIDLEYSILGDSSKNTLTSTDSSDKEKAATGFLGLVTYHFDEKFLMSIRHEISKEDPLQESLKSSTSTGGVLCYKIDPAVEIRAEYITYSHKSMSDIITTAQRMNLSTVFNF